MSIHLQAHFRARTVSDEARITFPRRNNQESGDGVHSISQALPPLERSNRLRQRRFNARVRVYKVGDAGHDDGQLPIPELESDV